MKGNIKSTTAIILMFSLIAISMIALSASAEGIIASVSNPKMILYHNVSPEQPLVFQNNVRVNNKNEFPITVKLSTMDDLLYLVELDDEKATLEPGETREMMYTVTIYRPGVYKGDIVAAFQKDETQNVAGALSQILIIAVSPAEGYEEATFPTTTTLPEHAKRTDDTGVSSATTLASSQDENINGSSDDVSSTTTSTPSAARKPSPIVGIGIIAIILAVGLGIYLIIILAGGKK